MSSCSSVRLESCINCTLVLGVVQSTVVINKCENVTIATVCQSLHIRWAIKCLKDRILHPLTLSCIISYVTCVRYSNFVSSPAHLVTASFTCVSLIIHWFWVATLTWGLAPTILTITNWRITWDSVDSTPLLTTGTHPLLLEVYSLSEQVDLVSLIVSCFLV